MNSITLRRWALPLFMVACATTAEYILHQATGDAMTAPYTAAVLVCAVYSDLGGAMMCVLLSAVSFGCFLDRFPNPTPQNLVHLTVFLTLVCFIVAHEQQRRRTEQRTRQERQRAQQELLAEISHDLRNPVNSITAALALLRKECPSEVIEVIERNLKVQSYLIEDIIDNSLILTDTFRLNLSNVDLRQVADDAAVVFRPIARRKGLTLGVEGHGIVLGDHNRLLRVFMNLISNAVKYTDRGSIHVTVSDQGFEIRDTGTGIPHDKLTSIFDRGIRIQQADLGLGLGLAIVRQIIVAHRGSVTVDSTPGHGSKFTVKLPRKGEL